jgi:4-amino-4-deoxy-L-arabinose transferase-like glycosyltransferase
MRRVVPLRLTGIVFGVITVVCAFAFTRLMTDDPWTPVLAALVVAFLPKFAFLSGVINNDNLATALASVATVLVALYIGRRFADRRNAGLLITTGVVLGAGLLAKLTVAPVAMVLVLAVGIWSDDRLRSLAMMLVPMAIVFAPWTVHNTIAYGDPLLLSTAKEYFLEVRPSLILESVTLHRVVVGLPQGVWGSFWYTSGWNQVRWVWYFYIPLWILLALGVGGLIPRWSTRSREQTRLFVLAIGVGLAGMSNVWLAGLQTTQHQARIAFVGLVAIAGLVSVGYEWIRWPPLRFGLPMASLLVLVTAIVHHVLPLS